MSTTHSDHWRSAVKHKRTYLLAAALFLLGVGKGGVDAQATIGGVVTDCDTGQPVSGATIMWGYYDIRATTDSSGNYEFTDVPCFNNVLTVIKSGYVTHSEDYTPICLSYNVINVTICTTTTSFAGYVLDCNTGVGVGGAIVAWNGDSRTTDSAGSYAFADQPCSIACACSISGLTSTNDSAGELGFDFILDVHFQTPCQEALDEGDVLQFYSQNLLAVTQPTGPPDGNGVIINVKARNLAETPITILSLLLGLGTVHSSYPSTLTVTKSGYVTHSEAYTPICLASDAKSVTICPISHVSHVYMECPALPMSGVKVEVLGTSFVTYTDAAGSYHIPYMDGEYGIRASVTYTEPATGQAITVYNYPDRDPGRSYDLGGGVELPPIVFPRPVLMQAGWQGEAETWDSLAGYLTQDPAGAGKLGKIPGYLCFPMPSDSIWPWGDNNPAGYNNNGRNLDDHAENAELLSDWFDSAVSPVLMPFIGAQGIDRVEVDIVAHSMGGLIARAYSHDGLEPPVRRIVSLAGVHGGTSNIYVPAGLTEDNLNGVQAGGTGAEPLRGWNEDYPQQIDTHDLLLLGAGLDLVVIPHSSSYGIGAEREYYWLDPPGSLVTQDTGGTHAWLTGVPFVIPGAGHSGIHDLAQSTGVGELTGLFLIDGPGKLSGYPVPSLRTAPQGGEAFVRLEAVAGGMSKMIGAFDVNGIIRGQAIVEGGGSYEIAVPGPFALTLENLESESLGDGVVLDRFDLTLPPTGDITVTLTAGAMYGSSLDLVLEFDNGRKLILGSSEAFQTVGSPVQLTASMQDALGNVLVPTGASFATVEVELPDETTQAVPLADDGLSGDGVAGDGIFGASFTITQEGRYSVCGLGRVSFGAENVVRSARVMFAGKPTGASLTGPPTELTPDGDSNGLLDALVFEQVVTFTKNGLYRLSADLVDLHRAPIISLSASYKNTAGVAASTLSLIAPGPDLVRHGVGGPWTLSNVILTGLDALPIDKGPDSVSINYSITAFESPPAPTISWLIPSSGDVRGGNQVILHGSSLADATVVRVNGKAAAFVVSADDVLLVTIPNGQGRKKKLHVDDVMQYVGIEVTTPWGVAVAERGYAYEW